MRDPGADGIVAVALISLAGAILLVPVVLDILAVFGVGFAFRPTLRFTLKKPDAVSRFRFFSAILSLFVIVSWFLSLGWLRVLFGFLIVIHFAAFRTVSWFHLRARSNPSDWLLLFAGGTFCLGYFFLPDFGDSEDSAVAFFGLVRRGPLLDAMVPTACVLLTANVVLLVILAFAAIRPKGNSTETEADKGQ